MVYDFRYDLIRMAGVIPAFSAKDMPGTTRRGMILCARRYLRLQ